jgi:L-cysteate sulfo-lyase
LGGISGEFSSIPVTRRSYPDNEQTSHAGPAYGVPHDATVEAIKLAGTLEALVLDPVYSGKGLAGLIALVRTGRWQSDDNVIFLHTGGAPALFAYRSALTI